MRAVGLLLAFALVQALEEIKDGETIFLDSSVDPDVTFIYRSPEAPSSADFLLTVTLYSATESLKLCVSVGKPAYDCQYEGSALRPVVVVPAAEVNRGKSVYVLLLCGKCRYRLTAARSKPVALKADKSVIVALDGAGKAWLRYKRRSEGEHTIMAKSLKANNALQLASERQDFTCVRQWDYSRLCPLIGEIEDTVWTVSGTPFSLLSVVRAM